GSFSPQPPAGSVNLTPTPPWAQSLPPVRPSGGTALFDEFAGSDEVQTPASEEARALPTEQPTAREAASEPNLKGPQAPLKALQVHDSYLIAETSDGMMVIDQHALHERILFEELRQRVEQGGMESQRLLVPEPVNLDALEVAVVLEQRDVLS